VRLPETSVTPSRAPFNCGTVGVVVPTCNTRSLLRECLVSLERQRATCDLEVVVVDNGSRDHTARMVQSEFPDVRVVPNPVNRGYSGGVNDGLAVLPDTDLTVILNTDTVVSDGAFVRLWEELSSLSDVGAACPRCVHEDGSPMSYGAPIWRARDFARECLFLLPRLQPVDHTRSGYVGSASGACLCLTRRGRQALAGLDEGLVIYLEEQDVARRLQQSHLYCYYASSSVVVHKGSRTTSSMDAEALFEATHLARSHFYWKHFSWPTALGLRGLAAGAMALRAVNSLGQCVTRPTNPVVHRRLAAKLSALAAYLGLGRRNRGGELLSRLGASAASQADVEDCGGPDTTPCRPREVSGR
jgi:GT2 family glycosyltransferase